jgi:dTMP kinase
VSQRGKFISLEGGEGVGKSTQVRALAEALGGLGLDVLVTREPGGSAGAERIRELLLGSANEWSASSEALLFAAARADHVEKLIAPALASGRWVLCDRFVDSSLAYQGGAGELGVDAVRAINRFAIGDVMPDRSLILHSEQGARRASERDAGASDAIGGRSDDYHRQVDAAFRALAAEEPARARLIDASGSREKVTQRLIDAIRDLLP